MPSSLTIQLFIHRIQKPIGLHPSTRCEVMPLMWRCVMCYWRVWQSIQQSVSIDARWWSNGVLWSSTYLRMTQKSIDTFSALMISSCYNIVTLAGLQSWSQKWLLSLNTKKCCVVSYGRSVDKTVTYTLVDHSNHEAVLERYDKVKDLGVWFDEKLSFREHNYSG